MLSCANMKKNSQYVIVPEENNKPETNDFVDLDGITETKNGKGGLNLPEWLLVFKDGGINAVEEMDQYYGKYCFIARNKGDNFEALTKWADNFPEAGAFTRLAAARIENRLTLNIALYPDDEYGAFYEKLIKKAYDAEYPWTITEDSFWIKKPGSLDANGFQSDYEFFAFISIDKTIMQDEIKKMIEETRETVKPTRAQINAINNIQLHFFEGF